MVDFSGIASATWVLVPKVLHFGLKFDFAACAAMGILFAINAVQVIGDFTATTVGGFDRESEDEEIQGGIIAYGFTNIICSLFGSLPTATYSQNVGIATTNKVVNRTVFAMIGMKLIVSQKFSA